MLADRESGTVAELATFRNEALNRKDWESVREADFHSLRVSFNERDFDYLMFGTPFADYR